MKPVDSYVIKPPSQFLHKEYTPFNNDDPNLKYEVIKGKEIKVNDIIVHSGGSIVVTKTWLGRYAGGEFGEYVHVEGYCPAAFYCPIMIKFWTAQNTPTIKLINYI